MKLRTVYFHFLPNVFRLRYFSFINIQDNQPVPWHWLMNISFIFTLAVYEKVEVSVYVQWVI